MMSSDYSNYTDTVPVPQSRTPDELKIASLEHDLNEMRLVLDRSDREIKELRRKLAEAKSKYRGLKYLVQAQAKFINENTDHEDNYGD